MEKSPWKIFRFMMFLIVLTVLPCMALNYIVDPLQFYRRSYYFNNKLYPYQRYQNPGLARTYGYDTVIIGTSMTENFLPSDVSEALGFDALKLSISAASAYEQKRMLMVAADTGKVKNVLWGIDFSSFRGSADRTGDDGFPEYLYDRNVMNDFNYLLNDKTTELSFNTLIRLIRSGPADKYIDVSRYSFWYPYVEFGEEEMRENGKAFEEKNKGMGNEYDREELLKSAEQNLIQTVARYPEIEFYIFYTPASVLREKFFMSEGIFDIQTDFKKYINEGLLKFDNVKLYDFQAAGEIILDFDRYSDYSHYDLSVMRYMLDCISKGRYLVTGADGLLEKFIQTAGDYEDPRP